MNPLEARRRILADPRAAAPELRDAVEHDPHLAAYRAELLALDGEVRRAVMKVPAPEGLADRLILRARYPGRPRWHAAIAAGCSALALATALLVAVERPAVASTMIDHVVAQEWEWQDTRGVSPAVLRAAVAELGVTVRDGDYRVRHLGPCVVGGRQGRHFTIDGPRGPIAFIVLPAQDRGDEPVLLSKEGVRGLFAKRAGSTVGVFSRSGETREELAELLKAVIA